MIQRTTPTHKRNLKKRGIFLPLLRPLLGRVLLFTMCLLLAYAIGVVVLLLSFTNSFRSFHPGIEVLLKDTHPFQLLQGPCQLGIRPRFLFSRLLGYLHSHRQRDIWFTSLLVDGAAFRGVIAGSSQPDTRAIVHGEDGLHRA